ncbi:hypothetical protein B1690_00055 [Geobacillus sp. 46C-IIa]|uniref:DUF5667 domain-containing protein n=1 Tax=Geobacillus sp. 46C-IIa TaxID=1963025 RepID=UPI0009BE7395|nr:DUF5667 domain-containing protein [Geobacillus sp. 46C-IIa]OQP07721.1 hypothetical protein B1690_00055 [Geobacillus sp. 46C-IIa]QNU27122.1 hypothetical protein IC803_12505 [Geobacillus sp. 46C-IIa]
MTTKRFTFPRVLSASALAATVALAPYHSLAFASTDIEGQTNKNTMTETTVNANDDAPTLLPGDFFYFVKTMIEKIELALTFDDAEKAKRLAEFAEERLAEAKALLEQGEIEQAKEVLANALKQQEAAWDVYEGTKQADEQNGERAETDVEALRQQLEEKFSQNIIALQTALEQVKNPRAKEVLARNIDKAKQKLEAKIEKRLAKQAQRSGEVEETDNKTTTPTDETEESKNESAPSAPESTETEKPAPISAPAEDKAAIQQNEQTNTGIKAETKSSSTQAIKVETKGNAHRNAAASAKANGQKHQAATAVNKQAEARVSVSHSQQLKQAAAPQVKADHPAVHGKRNKQEKNRK